MIILRLRGGLGNQLFQYAAAAALANFHSTKVKLDLYYYKKHPYRKFELDKLNVPVEIATREEVHSFTGSNPVVRYFNKRENYLRCPAVFAQPHYHFFDDFLRLPENTYLSGYFQSEKYFRGVENNVGEWYTPRAPFDQKSSEVRDALRSSESVALHIRRGDYTKSQFSSFGILPIEYYTTAIRTIRNNVANPSFFIFSDDPEWCKSQLDLGEKVTFVSHNKGDDSYKDLLLMSASKHNIIANSSFSWWGAWLNRSETKTVIAPGIWFSKEYYTGKVPVYPARLYNTKDLIPPTWVRL